MYRWSVDTFKTFDYLNFFSLIEIGSTLSGLFGGGDGANVDKNVPEQDTAVNTTDDGGVNLTHVNTVNITKNSVSLLLFLNN